MQNNQLLVLGRNAVTGSPGRVHNTKAAIAWFNGEVGQRCLYQLAAVSEPYMTNTTASPDFCRIMQMLDLVHIMAAIMNSVDPSTVTSHFVPTISQFVTALDKVHAETVVSEEKLDLQVEKEVMERARWKLAFLAGIMLDQEASSLASEKARKCHSSMTSLSGEDRQKSARYARVVEPSRKKTASQGVERLPDKSDSLWVSEVATADQTPLGNTAVLHCRRGTLLTTDKTVISFAPGVCKRCTHRGVSGTYTMCFDCRKKRCHRQNCTAKVGGTYRYCYQCRRGAQQLPKQVPQAS